jgi:hypothetical protein
MKKSRNYICVPDVKSIKVHKILAIHTGHLSRRLSKTLTIYTVQQSHGTVCVTCQQAHNAESDPHNQTASEEFEHGNGCAVQRQILPRNISVPCETHLLLHCHITDSAGSLGVWQPQRLPKRWIILNIRRGWTSKVEIPHSAKCPSFTDCKNRPLSARNLYLAFGLTAINNGRVEQGMWILCCCNCRYSVCVWRTGSTLCASVTRLFVNVWFMVGSSGNCVGIMLAWYC